MHSNQPNLGRWWAVESSGRGEGADRVEAARDSAVDLSSSPHEGECSACMNDLLGSLCWGFRGLNWIYGGVSYSVTPLFNDPHVGAVWYAEPHLTVTFMRNGKFVKVNGTFRHTSCSKVDRSGRGFVNLSCELCSSIPKENDFYKRVVREHFSVEKRGGRSTGAGRRLAYLSIPEIADHARLMRRKLRSQKLQHRSAQARIVQLKLKRPSLRELARDAACDHNVLKFCYSIVNAHRSGALGGKPALWDFLRDVAENLNHDRRGQRYRDNMKCLGEVMKVHGGRRMVDIFALNFAGPSYRQVKREVRKGVQFLPGEHAQIFAVVAQIYREAKLAHNIVGPVPVILPEDETKVKGRVAWEPKWDTLAGFCGPSENHVCVPGFRPLVGSGEEGYRQLLESFGKNRKGTFAQVVVVNPLHERLPRLVLVVCCTCNCFNSDWVRGQWDTIDRLWEEECLVAVGPIIGHTSDGDSRRRQLMLADYQSNEGICLDVGWEGWVFSASLNPSGNAKGLHDQDYIHNGKKLINPLLSAARTLQLGGDLCLHGHIEQVYEQFTVEEHGLIAEDVERRDRQNWAAAQRLCQFKVRSCLAHMRQPGYPHRERTLGTEFYLEICAAYIDIFCSPRLDLRSRVVLCGKVLFFFRLWRLWLQHGDHGVLGNSQPPVQAKNFVSLQCFIDIQLSCHFVVLLICHFRDKFPNLAVPLHLTGSDSCEIFFSRIGGMNGLERAYDFHELVNTANTLNHISAVEYGNNGLVFQKQHNKMENVWESLHKLTLGEQRPNLGDYSLIAGNADVVSALQEGLKEAQSMLRSLNMAPSAQCQSCRKIWFDRPWLAEREDRQCFHYKPSARLTSGEDGDSEVLRDRLVSELSAAEPPAHAPQMRDNLEESAAEEDESEHWRIIEEEARDAVTDVLNSAEVQVQQPQGSERIEVTVEVDGHVIYKSTLMSQLNGSVFLSKDRLARIKHSAQFNNHDNFL